MMKTKSDIESLISRMTPAQKAGQLFLLAFPGKNPELIRPFIEQYGIGGCYISQDNAESFEEAEKLSTELQTMSLKAQSIPLLLGVDQEGSWGVLVPESHTGPGNMALGSINDLQVVSSMYRILGEEMLSVGYNTIFGPCSDINSDPLSPIIGTRSFGQYPGRVSSCVRVSVESAKQVGILSCLKHFPGHGATSGDTHRSIPQVNKSFSELMAMDLLPFKAGIDAGAPIIMTSHIKYPQIDPENPATLSSRILKGILRETLGFSGIIISDSMNMGAIRNTYNSAESTLKALQAGVDIVMLSEEHYEFMNGDYLRKQIESIELVKHAIEQKTLSDEFVNEKLFRILDCKFNKMKIRTPRLSKKEYDRNGYEELCISYKSIGLLQKGLWPLPQKGTLVCINATPMKSYMNVINPRGIGPNQRKSAYESFREEFAKYRKFETYDSIMASESIEKFANVDFIIVVSEDYPLPGEDFEKREQKKLICELSERYPEKLIIVGLRSSYEIMQYPTNVTYLCSYSSRNCSAIASARFLAEGRENGPDFLPSIAVRF